MLLCEHKIMKFHEVWEVKKIRLFDFEKWWIGQQFVRSRQLLFTIPVISVSQAETIEDPDFNPCRKNCLDSNYH